MSAENIFDKIKQLIPSEKEKHQGTVLADRFDTIKLRLKELGVEVQNSGIRDFDDKFITTISLSFDKTKLEEVHSILNKADIEPVNDAMTPYAKWALIGLLTENGATDSHLKRVMDNEQICIYKGKYIKSEDVLRLVTLEPKFIQK